MGEFSAMGRCWWNPDPVPRQYYKVYIGTSIKMGQRQFNWWSPLKNCLIKFIGEFLSVSSFPPNSQGLVFPETVLNSVALDFGLLSISKILLSIFKILSQILTLHLTLSMCPNSNGRISADIRNWTMGQVGHTLFRYIPTIFVWGVCWNSDPLKMWLSVHTRWTVGIVLFE